jgi:drug/metabolite transporter (DMT)-like permease
MARSTRKPDDHSSKPRDDSTLPDLSLIGVALIWGVNIPLMKTGMDQSDRFWFNGIRLIISAFVLLCLGVREYRRGIRPATDLKRHHVVIYAVIVSVLYQFLFLLGISQTTSGNTALIISTIPVWTAVGATIFLNEKLRGLAWLGLSVAFAGTLIVTFQKDDIGLSREHLVGNLCILGAALSWAAGTIYSRPLLKKISPLQLSAWSASLGLPFHLLIAAPAILAFPAYATNLSVWMALLYSGVFSTGLALAMWNFGVQYAGAAHAAIIQNLVPVVAMASAFLLRNESVTEPQMFGGGLIIGGLLIMRFGRNERLVRGSKPAMAPDS